MLFIKNTQQRHKNIDYMYDLGEELKGFVFQKKGYMTLNKDETLPEIKLFDLLETFEGNVSLWVTEIDEKPSQIIYIGKAGKTLLIRCVQHMNGFVRGRSKKGFENGIALLSLLKENIKIAVYARRSQRMEILGMEDISLCEAEENAMLRRYRKSPQLLNKL